MNNATQDNNNARQQQLRKLNDTLASNYVTVMFSAGIVGNIKRDEKESRELADKTGADQSAVSATKDIFAGSTGYKKLKTEMSAIRRAVIAASMPFGDNDASQQNTGWRLVSLVKYLELRGEAKIRIDAWLSDVRQYAQNEYSNDINNALLGTMLDSSDYPEASLFVDKCHMSFKSKPIANDSEAWLQKGLPIDVALQHASEAAETIAKQLHTAQNDTLKKVSEQLETVTLQLSKRLDKNVAGDRLHNTLVTNTSRLADLLGDSAAGDVRILAIANRIKQNVINVEHCDGWKNSEQHAIAAKQAASEIRKDIKQLAGAPLPEQQQTDNLSDILNNSVNMF